MGQKSTLQRVVTAQLQVHGIELKTLLSQYPIRSFTAIRTEILMRTGVSLSTRTVRRWWNETQTVAAIPLEAS